MKKIKSLNPNEKEVLKIKDSYIIFFDDFRNLKLKQKADLIFADPPFGIQFNSNLRTYHRKPDSLSYIEVPRNKYPKFVQSLLQWSYEALKKNGSMWLISGWNNLDIILHFIKKSQFYLLNHCIWKYQFGVFTKRRFTTSHYHVLLMTKDEHNYTFNKPEHYAEDVWEIKRQYQHGIRTAGNELPDELVEKCISTSSNRGDLVIDPVLGSGTTMRACYKLRRKCIGIEINPLIKERIKTKFSKFISK